MAESKVDWTEHLDIAYISDIGMRRSMNQDAFSINLARDLNHFQQRGHLFIVCDGMGAHAAGELASRISADNVPHLYRKYNDISPPECLKRSIVETNAEVHRKGQANEEFHNMGTTCTVLTLLPQGAICGHVGDSRCYRLRGRRLEQITFDHSLVWEMREANKSIAGSVDISNSLPKNVITRSLGPYPDVNVDLEGPLPTEIGDTFLICSDGLTGLIPDEELGQLLVALEPTKAARFMVDLANLRGGNDNITIVIVKIKSQQMVTSNNSQPLKINAKPVDKNSTVLYWVFFAAFAVAALAAIFVHSYIAIALGVIAIGLLARILFMLSGIESGAQIVGGKRFGKGPYTKTDSKITKSLIDTLGNKASELRNAAISKNWKVDLEKLDKRVNEALAAADAGRYTHSVQLYASSICAVMDELRKQER